MGLKVYEADPVYWLACDRCHRTFGSVNDGFDDESLLFHCAKRSGWRERTDGALKPVKVWLCPGCARDVAIEQGEDVEQPAEHSRSI